MFEAIALRYNESKTRTKTRTKILAVAYGQFIKESINNVTMMRLSEVIEIDRKTLYRYYENKEELVVDVVLAIMENFKHLIGLTEFGEVNGITKLSIFLKMLYKKGILAHKEIFLFLTQFDMHLYEQADDSKAVKRYNESIESLGFNQVIEGILREGIADGSIVCEKAIDTEAKILVESIVAVAMRFYLLNKNRNILSIESAERLIELLVKGYSKID